MKWSDAHRLHHCFEELIVGGSGDRDVKLEIRAFADLSAAIARRFGEPARKLSVLKGTLRLSPAMRRPSVLISEAVRAAQTVRTYSAERREAAVPLHRAPGPPACC